MQKLKENFLVPGLVVLLCLTSYVRAETNNTFLNPTWEDAWGDMGEPYINSKGHLCIPNELVGTARIVMWFHFFDGHPLNNRYHDILLEHEVGKARLEFKLGDYIEKQKKYVWKIVGLLAIIIAETWALVKITYNNITK